MLTGVAGAGSEPRCSAGSGAVSLSMFQAWGTKHFNFTCDEEGRQLRSSFDNSFGFVPVNLLDCNFTAVQNLTSDLQLLLVAYLSPTVIATCASDLINSLLKRFLFNCST